MAEGYCPCDCINCGACLGWRSDEAEEVVVKADDLREVLGFGYAGEDILEVRSRLRAALDRGEA